MTKTDMIDAITLHFSKKGQRLTNLSKATIPMLQKTIEKYNLNMEELMEELRIHKINRQAEEKKRKDEQDRIDAEREKQRENEKQDILMKWRLITDADREYVRQVDYDNYVERCKKDNAEAILNTDRMYKYCVQNGDRIVRQGENVLVINGVNVNMGYIVRIKTKDEYTRKTVNNDDDNDDDDDDVPYDSDYWAAMKNKKIVSELCDKRMIEKGFTIKDGQYWITIKTTIKKRVATK
jgi:uncharacterized short protein YbdD (DUF466 family)